MLQKIKDWWYFNINGYGTDIIALDEIIKKKDSPMEFTQATELQKSFPRIIKQVTKELNGQVMVTIVKNNLLNQIDDTIRNSVDSKISNKFYTSTSSVIYSNIRSNIRLSLIKSHV